MSKTGDRLRGGVAAMALAVAITAAAGARAADLIAEWASIEMPPPPELKPAKVDAKTTALFLFDFMKRNCGQRPRCVAAVPRLKAIVERARAAGVMVAYTFPAAAR